MTSSGCRDTNSTQLLKTLDIWSHLAQRKIWMIFWWQTFKPESNVILTGSVSTSTLWGADSRSCWTSDVCVCVWFRDLPGHSRRSLQRPSSSSSAGRRSTRSGTWPRRGWGRRSSSGTEEGQDSWQRAADARWLCTPEAVSQTRVVSYDAQQSQTLHDKCLTNCRPLDSLSKALQRQRKATRIRFCLHPKKFIPLRGYELWVGVHRS